MYAYFPIDQNNAQRYTHNNLSFTEPNAQQGLPSMDEFTRQIDDWHERDRQLLTAESSQNQERIHYFDPQFRNNAVFPPLERANNVDNRI